MATRTTFSAAEACALIFDPDSDEHTDGADDSTISDDEQTAVEHSGSEPSGWNPGGLTIIGNPRCS